MKREMSISTHFFLVQTLLITSLFSFSHSVVPRKPSNPHKPPLSSSSGNATYVTRYFTQYIDHFDYTPQSYQTFQQRYLINTKEWGGSAKSRSPIFVYIGEQDDIEFIARDKEFMPEISKIFRSMLVFIEHRYYGKSIPFDGEKVALTNSSTLGYLNTQQALADVATLITDLKKNLTATDSPVIVFGSAYGGILASWFRLKYPHVALGALASSAPVLGFEDNLISPFKFTDIISQNIKSESQNCYKVIKNSWAEMEKTIKRKGGISRLAKSFKLCSPLPSKEVFKDRLFGLLEFSFIYASVSDYPLNSNIRSSLPPFPIKKMCEAVDNPLAARDTALKLYGALNSYFNFTGRVSCFDLNYKDNETLANAAGEWQECTELLESEFQNNAESIFPAAFKHQHKTLDKDCSKFNVKPRPRWISTQFGGHDMKRVLKRFGSNIIFFNGLRDPISAGGVLESISKSIVAITAPHGAHNVDLLFSQKKKVPKWLEDVRAREIKIIRKWIEQYNEDKNVV